LLRIQNKPAKPNIANGHKENGLNANEVDNPKRIASK
jgi:hypothetical protein